MIDSQLRPSGVNDPAVLARFAEVAREDFVPAGARSVAYNDRRVPLGEGRALAPALTHGLILSEAQPVPGDRALLVDGGSGYLAALVAPMVGSLETIAAGGKPKGKGFSLLLIDGAIEELPGPLAAVLDEGARVVTGLVERGVTRLAAGRKVGGQVSLLTLAEADFLALPAYARARSWSF
jgi:protein-L-isoaspartate(D-aspartate) O-methyltransferase